ncbi:MAG TPA: M20 family metallopeptidase [Pseudomonadota bacterium]|nr:M20 family metallopeptidase [Rhodanobacteraceae bacterium]MBP9154192.1 M20 family metallopeptidase [Xanthomonadales bacterium]HQW81657.1 M20 family metallopeptidase [Pseudomonadota bacterium]
MTDAEKIYAFCDEMWERQIIPQLTEYIKIPAKSPSFDAEWERHGYMKEAMDLIEHWVRAQPVAGMSVERIQLPGRTPLLFIEIPGKGDDVVLMYGHMDKQPEMAGWNVDLGAWKPLRAGDKLYGRGGADDGYATFASLTAVMALNERGIDHSRIVIVIEGCEESGSYDLPFYINHLADRIGKPSLVVCLDSGAGNYDQLWLTTSLRGLAGGTLNVRVLDEGVHSGDASGIVPSSFRILRNLLDRIEDSTTGRITADVLNVDIPGDRIRAAKESAAVLGTQVYDKFPWPQGVMPMNADLAELVLNRTWRPTLSVTGVDGLPTLGDAGNVLRPYTAVKLSVRIPPTLDPVVASNKLKEILEKDPPYGAKIEFDIEKSSQGWAAPSLVPWLADSVDTASKAWFGTKSAQMGEGGTIPFMGMLQDRFPEAQFVVTGLLGPKSNAHGPNEFLHIPTGKKLTAAMSKVIADHYVNRGSPTVA